MSETPVGGLKGSAGSSKIAVYGLCLVVGVALGTLVTLLVAGRNGGGSGSDPVVAEVDGKPVLASQALGSVKGRVFELEEEMFRTKEQAINDFVGGQLLAAQAKKQNMTVEALLEKESGGPVAETTDQELDAFLTSKGISANDPRISKADIKNYVKSQKQYEKQEAYVSTLKAAAKVKLLITEPVAPRITVDSSGFPAWGNAKAPVTIVEFSDYQCPYCAGAEETIKRIKKEFGPDKVRIVYMDMPIPGHTRALPASLAALCAEEQGKFWEYHDLLFTNQTKLEDSDFSQYAKTTSLDEKKFKECFDKKKYSDLVARSQQEASKAGIRATPSFLINGQLLQGAQPYTRFAEKINKEIKG